MQTSIKTIFYILIGAAFLSACKRNPLKVDISGIDDKVEIVRFEQELFNLSLKDTLEDFYTLRDKYPDFFDLFTWKVIGIGSIEEEFFPELMSEFLADTMVVSISFLTDKEFGDFRNIENRLIEAFKYYKYHVPEN